METTPTWRGYCIACGYPLQGLTTHRCPECGRAFDPANAKTFRNSPQGRLVRWLAKPVGWPVVILAIAGAVGVMAVSRWKISTFAPSTVDLVYYFNLSDLRHRTSLLTPRDYVFTLSMLAAAAAFLWWLLRTAVGIIIRWRSPFKNDEKPVHTGRRHALLAIASILTTSGAALGWPYRLAQQWAAHRLAANNIKPPKWPGLIGPPTVLSPSQTQATLRAAVIQLPQAAQRIAGLKLLIEDNPRMALPVLTEAVTLESDSAIRALELRLIGMHRNPSTLQLLTRFMTHPDAGMRAAAIDAVGLLHAPAFTIPLCQVEFWSPQTSATVGNIPITLDQFIAIKPMQIGRTLQLTMNEIPLPANIRGQLEWTMLTASTTGDREAAARALLAWPPASYKLRVAEWGVWINDHGQLKLVQSVLDEIPDFVHRTGNALTEFNDRINEIMFVTKPIIHITVDQPMAVDVNVIINGGRPWFAYPRPDDFAVRVDNLYYGQAGYPRMPPLFLSPLDNPKLQPLSGVRQGYPWLTPEHIVSGPIETGMTASSIPRNEVTAIGLRWQSVIVSPTRLPWMTLPDVGGDPRFAWWTRLRDVPSGWVSNQGETERFLYYDGPTLAPIPLGVAMTENKLTFTLPKKPDDFSKSLYADTTLADAALLVRLIAGKLSAQVISIPSSLNKNHPQITLTLAPDNLHQDQVIAKFSEMLTTAGLTPEEAEGLIASWQPQFFQTIGIRLLLFLSRSEYDNFCPIDIRPKPTEMVRVGIVLSELSAE